jgi:hypothetical protein
MAGTIPIAVLIGISSTVLSPGIVLDAISLWPGALPAIVALVIVAVRKVWGRRAGASPPLFLISWMVLTGAAHLGGWGPLPSSSADIAGPTSAPGAISMSVHPQGRLELSVLDEAANGTPVYRVGFVRLGGEVGIPAAEEVTNQTGLAVVVRDTGTTPWFRYGGWRLELGTHTQWNLSLGGEITGSLVGLDLASLAIDGGGTIKLGSAGHVVPIVVRGNVSLIVPVGVPVQVVGAAEVPVSWETTDSGTKAPATGEGWLISVAEGATLVIKEA